MIDRELYVPQGWIDDPQRLKAAGVPDQKEFATKPHLATHAAQLTSAGNSLADNMLTAGATQSAGEGVCAGGRDRYRTCDLCRVNESARAHGASLDLPQHCQTPGEGRGVALVRDVSRGVVGPCC